MKFCTQQQILNWMNVTWSKMKKLHWTDSGFDRTYFLLLIKRITVAVIPLTDRHRGINPPGPLRQPLPSFSLPFLPLPPLFSLRPSTFPSPPLFFPSPPFPFSSFSCREVTPKSSYGSGEALWAPSGVRGRSPRFFFVLSNKYKLHPLTFWKCPPPLGIIIRSERSPLWAMTPLERQTNAQTYKRHRIQCHNGFQQSWRKWLYLRKSIGQSSGIGEPVPRYQQRQHRRDADIRTETDAQCRYNCDGHVFRRLARLLARYRYYIEADERVEARCRAGNHLQVFKCL